MKLHTSITPRSNNALYILFIFIMILSCDSDDNNSDDEDVRPPLWIIGNWEGDRSNSVISPSYPIFEFTKDNINGKDWEEFNNPPFNLNRVIRTSSFKYEVEEINTTDSYEIIIQLANVPTSYKFVKENDSIIVLHYNYNKELLDPEPPYKMYKVEK